MWALRLIAAYLVACILGGLAVAAGFILQNGFEDGVWNEFAGWIYLEMSVYFTAIALVFCSLPSLVFRLTAIVVKAEKSWFYSMAGAATGSVVFWPFTEFDPKAFSITVFTATIPGAIIGFVFHRIENPKGYWG